MKPLTERLWYAHKRRGEESSIYMDAIEEIERLKQPPTPPAETKCSYCGGNDGDVPCAYPSEGKEGCLRDKRLSAVPAGMELTEREKRLVIAGFMNGYEHGHHDTVEACYGDAEESGKDWLNDALGDGGLKYTFDNINPPAPEGEK